MIKEVDVDGDGRIDFLEFARALGEPDNNSQDCEDEEEDDEDEKYGDGCMKSLNSSAATAAALLAEQPAIMRSPMVRTIITSPADSPRASMSADDFEQGPSSEARANAQSPTASNPLPRGNRATVRQMHPAKAKSPNRPYRSVSPNPTPSSRRLSNPFYERLRSPSLKDSLLDTSSQLLSSSATVSQERRPSLRTFHISEEVARLSKASFRESYNAIAKPNQKRDPDSPSSGTKSPYALDFSSLQALRESYKALVKLTGDQGVDGGEVTTNSSRRSSTNEYRRKRSPVGDTVIDTFDILDASEDEAGADGSEASRAEVDPASYILAYRSVPGFDSGAFYMARMPLD